MKAGMEATTVDTKLEPWRDLEGCKMRKPKKVI
jgi:hypothetical protein